MLTKTISRRSLNKWTQGIRECICDQMKDGVVQSAGPEDLVAYTCVPFGEWLNDIPYA